MSVGVLGMEKPPAPRSLLGDSDPVDPDDAVAPGRPEEDVGGPAYERAGEGGGGAMGKVLRKNKYSI